MAREWGEVSEALICSAYPELRQIAGRLMRGERYGHTLQPTALVHEAFLRLFGSWPGDYASSGDFLAVAIRQMRRILIDYARRRASLKAGGARIRVTLFEEDRGIERDEDGILALDEALDRLGEIDQRALAVVEMKFFAGFTNGEAAAALGVSDGTVESDWQFARSWLYGALDRRDRLPR